MERPRAEDRLSDLSTGWFEGTPTKRKKRVMKTAIVSGDDIEAVNTKVNDILATMTAPSFNPFEDADVQYAPVADSQIEGQVIHNVLIQGFVEVDDDD